MAGRPRERDRLLPFDRIGGRFGDGGRYESTNGRDVRRPRGEGDRLRAGERNGERAGERNGEGGFPFSSFPFCRGVAFPVSGGETIDRGYFP